MNDPSPHELRRAWFSGYNAADVEVILAQFSLRVSQLWNELQATKERLDEADRERRELTRLLEESHRRELELAGTAGQAQALRSQAEADGRRHAQEIVDAAHLDAARVRSEAALEAEQARSQVGELLRLRETLASTMRAFTREFDAVMSGGERVAAPAPSPSAAAPPLAAPVPLPAERVVAPLPPTASVFDRNVEIEAGPFTDFASLSAFERELGVLPNVENVYIRRFEGDRATIEVTLDEPSPLLDELTRRLPYRLSIDHAAQDRIALRLSAAS